MGEHTPGPWRVDFDALSSGYPVVAAERKRAGGTKRICSVRQANRSSAAYAEAEANAALIASAPDLKAENERLKAALERLSRNVRGLMVLEAELRGIAGNTNVNALQEVLSAARNALGEKSDG